MHCYRIDQQIGSGVLLRETEAIVAAEHLEDLLSIEFVSRVPPELMWADEGQPTILIVAPWEDGCLHVWERVVRRVKQMADAHRVKSAELGNLDIAVEMIEEELTLQKYISLVPAEILALVLEQDWPGIKHKVFQILEGHPATRGHTTAISLFRLGFSACDSDNNNTVYISLDYASSEAGWPPAANELQHWLGQYPYADLALHMEHNTVEPYPFILAPAQADRVDRAARKRVSNLRPETPYKTAVDLGADIGASKYVTAEDGQLVSPTHGTLGCWLEIKSDEFPNWTKVALTNYHVIRAAYDGFTVGVNDGQRVAKAPTAGSPLLRIDQGGVVPTQEAPRIEHPTRAKHHFRVEDLRQLLTLFPSSTGKAEQDELDHMLDFFDKGKNEFGTVYGASGFGRRTPNNGRLDWALILPLDQGRVGMNKLPSLEDWHGKYPGSYAISRYPRVETFGAMLGQPPPSGLRGLGHEENIYKVGATTRLTVGQFSKTVSSLKLRDDEHGGGGFSQEYAVVGALVANTSGDARVADMGDSGSVVWDKEGRPVDLLFRGQKPQQTDKGVVAYVTLIEDVLADIKDFSGGRIHEIRVAGD